MRLWSLHPKYLDRQGLLAVWREGLLAQSVLLKGEYHNCSKCNGIGKYDEFENTKEWQRFIDCEVCKGTGKIKTPWYNHPQLDRFKITKESLLFITKYLVGIGMEANRRGYWFKPEKIKGRFKSDKHFLSLDLTVTKGQLEYEWEHLQDKLYIRDNDKWNLNQSQISAINSKDIEPHPLFKIVKGEIEKWEKIK